MEETTTVIEPGQMDNYGGNNNSYRTGANGQSYGGNNNSYRTGSNGQSYGGNNNSNDADWYTEESKRKKYDNLKQYKNGGNEGGPGSRHGIALTNQKRKASHLHETSAKKTRLDVLARKIEKYERMIRNLDELIEATTKQN